MSNSFNSPYLVETDWLTQHLTDTNLRILDCTVFLKPGPDGMIVESGRNAWSESHIPGSQFVDVLDELSDKEATYPFMMPSAQQFADAMSSYGIDDSTQVILYDAGATIWATRVWWMLRAFGFDQAAVLNGGWVKWQQEGQPITADGATYPAGNFVANPRPALIASKADVLAATQDGATCIVNALGADQHNAGHIPSSVNLPAGSLLDPDTNAFRNVATLRAAFDHRGALGRERIITYCGGGIAATSDAFVLTLLGAENVAVYDGSMSEWSADSSLSLERS